MFGAEQQRDGGGIAALAAASRTAALAGRNTGNRKRPSTLSARSRAILAASAGAQARRAPAPIVPAWRKSLFH